jgi:hypothetical protein
MQSSRRRESGTLNMELEVAREEIRTLKAGNVSSSIRELNTVESWYKPKNQNLGVADSLLVMLELN